MRGRQRPLDIQEGLKNSNALYLDSDSGCPRQAVQMLLKAGVVRCAGSCSGLLLPSRRTFDHWCQTLAHTFLMKSGRTVWQRTMKWQEFFLQALAEITYAASPPSGRTFELPGRPPWQHVCCFALCSLGIAAVCWLFAWIGGRSSVRSSVSRLTSRMQAEATLCWRSAALLGMPGEGVAGTPQKEQNATGTVSQSLPSCGFEEPEKEVAVLEGGRSSPRPCKARPRMHCRKRC